MSAPSDRNLLLGILALQMDFVSRDQLIAAMQAWVLDKTKSLDQILLDQEALRVDVHPLLTALVEKHVELHAGNIEQSLSALTTIGSVRTKLQSLEDTDIDATLTFVGQDSGESGAVAEEPVSNPMMSVGGLSSDGRRFRILHHHAEGGLGVVSVARDEELNREVALKEIRPRYADDPVSRARFLVEAEVTGGLEHPGIVPVYGLGQFGDGRPFYAMRFIRGDSLKQAVTRFQGRQHVDSSQRVLELRKLLGRFVDVCQAMEYAHSRGILHRDLKPGNIMLGKYGETLVVDWGLAKPIGRSGIQSHTDEQTLRPSSKSGSAPTQLGSAVGTPAYMSPEQAAGKTEDLDPSSDVYSLGATLYFLLTGQPPVTGKDMDAVLDRVQTGDFPTPREVNRDVPRALEAICLRALAKSSTVRYCSAQALADDVERFLADEPVTAYAEPLHLQARRWLRKHPAASAAASISAALLLLFLGIGFVAVSSFNRRLEAALERAEENFDLARGAVADYLHAVTDNHKLRQADLHDLRIELLETAQPFYRRLLQDSPDDKGTRASQADAHYRLAAIYSETGDFSASREQGDLAVDGWKQLQREFPNEPIHRRQLANAHTMQAATLSRQGQLRRAKEEFEKSLTINRDLAALYPKSLDYRQQLASAHNNLGTAWLRLEDSSNARLYFRQAIASFRQLLDEEPQNVNFQRSLAAGHTNLGSALVETNDRQSALTEYGAAQELLEKLIEKTPDREYRSELANVYEQVGSSKRHLGDIPGALESYERCLQVTERLVAEFPAVMDYRGDLAGAHSVLANLHRELGGDTGTSHFDASIRIHERLAEDFPDTPDYRHELARDHMNYAMLLGDLGNDEFAQQHSRRAVELREELVADYPEVTAYLYDLAMCYTALGVTRAEANEWDEAIREFQRAAGQYESLMAKNPQDAKVRGDLAGTLSNLGLMFVQVDRPLEAKTQYLKSLDIRQKLAADFPDPEFRANLAEGRQNLATLLARLEDHAAAQEQFEAARKLSEQLWEERPELVQNIVRLGKVYSDYGQYQVMVGGPADGVDWYQRSIQLLTPVVTSLPQLRFASTQLGQVHARRATALDQLEQHAEAASDWRRAAELASGEQKSEYLRNADQAAAKAEQESKRQDDGDAQATKRKGRLPLFAAGKPVAGPGSRALASFLGNECTARPIIGKLVRCGACGRSA